MDILILMSTYNGVKYIEEQLDSIRLQQYVNVSFLIRDDGSTDETLEVISNYINIHPNITIKLIQGDNIGASKSFFSLLEIAKSMPVFDLYAFCDQDDVWLPDKLNTAVSCLNKLDNKQANLYCSGYEIVDAELNTVKVVTNNHIEFNSLGQVMLESCVPGCTMVFNYALLGTIKPTAITIFHDRWAFLTAFLLGSVYYDHVAKIKYRQHGSNVVGVSTNKKLYSRIRNRIKSKPSSLSTLPLVASELLRCYSLDITTDKIKTLNTCAKYTTSFREYMNLLLGQQFKINNQDLSSWIILKLKVLFKMI